MYKIISKMILDLLSYKNMNTCGGNFHPNIKMMNYRIKK